MEVKPIITMKNFKRGTRVELLGIDISTALTNFDYSTQGEKSGNNAVTLEINIEDSEYVLFTVMQRIMRRSWQMPTKTMLQLRKRLKKKPRIIFLSWTKSPKYHPRLMEAHPLHLHLVVVGQAPVCQVQSEMWIMAVWQRARPHWTRSANLLRNLLICSRSCGSHSRTLGRKRARIPLIPRSLLFPVSERLPRV